MARDGSGAYSLPAGNPVTTGTSISSTVHNATMADISAALTQSLSKDGQTTPSANQPMGGFRHTGVADGVAATDYASMSNLAKTGNNYSGLYLINANTTLPAAYAGALIELYGTTTFTVTMPLTSAVSSLSKIRLINLNTVAITLSRQGSDVFLDGSGTNPTAYTLYPGESIELSAGNGWIVVGGTAALRTSSRLGISAVENGYQKLPSGLIVQWGLASSSASVALNVSYPITFPAQAFIIVVSCNDTSAPTMISATLGTLSSFVLSSWNNANARIATAVRFVAIGA